MYTTLDMIIVSENIPKVDFYDKGREESKQGYLDVGNNSYDGISKVWRFEK